MVVAVLQGSRLSERLMGDYLSAGCERLRSGESLSLEAMVIEDALSAKPEELDRLKA